jgi:hypothetical protein
VQLTILLYWSLYWPELRSHWGWIGLHVLFCYGLDAALAWAADRPWRLTAGMFPVVFSTNLFLYYVDESMLYAYALYVVALVGKATLRRDGRHIFNPSALGMSVMIGLELLVPSWMAHHVDVDHAFLLAPNMMELLFLVALAGQFRLPIVYTTLGAWLVLETGVGSFGIAPVSAYYPSTFIAILLLVTDPRTSARSPVGQLLYGAVYGLGTSGCPTGSSGPWGTTVARRSSRCSPPTSPTPGWIGSARPCRRGWRGRSPRTRPGCSSGSPVCCSRGPGSPTASSSSSTCGSRTTSATARPGSAVTTKAG